MGPLLEPMLSGTGRAGPDRFRACAGRGPHYHPRPEGREVRAVAASETPGKPARRARVVNLALCLLAAALLGAAGLCAWLCLAPNRETPGEEPPESIPTADSAPGPGHGALAVPMFKQWDQRWGDDPVGGSGEPLRSVGCTVSCVAMAFRHFGMDTDPGRLNAWLRASGGY